jgi:hypothetical protein
VALRYITRAGERYETRTRLYRAIVELLHTKGKGEGEAVAIGPAPAAGPAAAS